MGLEEKNASMRRAIWIERKEAVDLKYELTKDLMTGNSTIDQEHRELFAAVNNMMDACAKGQGRSTIEPTMKFLLDYVNKHFTHEEELHQKSGFPDLAAHKQFHAGYAKKLRELAAAIPATGPTITDVGNINQHIGVLVSHIRSTDKKLGAFLTQKG